MIGNKRSLLYFATSNESIYLVGYLYRMWLKLEMLHTMLRVKTNENRNGWNHQPGKLHASQNGKTPYSSKPCTQIFQKTMPSFNLTKSILSSGKKPFTHRMLRNSSNGMAKSLLAKYDCSEQVHLIAISKPTKKSTQFIQKFLALFAGGPGPMQIRTAVKLLEVPKKRSMTLTKGKCKAKREAPL